MNWKFWRKEPQSIFQVETHNVSMPSLARWYLYDTEVANPNTVATEMGLVPTSPEGETAEVDASQLRRSRVEPYAAFIGAIADINANAMVALNRSTLESMSDVTDEEFERVEQIMLDLYGSISFLALMSGFSAALELGIIKNPGVVLSKEITDGGSNDE